MTNSTLKVAPATKARTDKEAARAAPVALPAGSYDLSKLEQGLNDASSAKNDDRRGELVDAHLSKINETPLPADTSGVTPGYKRVTVADEGLGIKEERVVFDAKQRSAATSQKTTQPAEDPAKVAETATDKKGD